MENGIALKCSCQKMRAAGWQVRCYACGTGFEDGAVSRFAEALYLEVEAEDRRRERGDRLAEAAGDGWPVEDYDVARDDQLVAVLDDYAALRGLTPGERAAYLDGPSWAAESSAALSHPAVTLDVAS